jgi:tetraacyldisaccharide 4'-kinase
MSLMQQLRLILLPISFLYGCINTVRNFLYSMGILPSTSFKIPVISVGNLTVGGTGKTPQIEYLIRLLKDKYAVATLSRGYGRSTSGFVYADQNSTSTAVGDEPRQFKHKFTDLPVAVDANRVHGIKKLQEDHPELKAILLDDAFQHRAVKPAVSILLSDYSKLYYNDDVLPTGTLREFKGGARRADIIVITKCPANFSPIEKRVVTSNIHPEPYQQIYFTSIVYGELVPMLEQKDATLNSETHVILLTGIANAAPLINFISGKTKHITHIDYPDHHEYSIVEMENLRKQFESIPSPNKIIITTEKDAMRIDKAGIIEVVQRLPLFYIPIETTFLFDEGEAFNKQILEHVKGNPQLN